MPVARFDKLAPGILGNNAIGKQTAGLLEMKNRRESLLAKVAVNAICAYVITKAA